MKEVEKMLFRLVLYLGILLVGGLIGYKEIAGKRVVNKLNYIQSGALLFILFVMGVKIGSDERVISSFLKLGFQAIILSVFSIVFSILFVKLIGKLVIKDADKEEISNES